MSNLSRIIAPNPKFPKTFKVTPVFKVTPNYGTYDGDDGETYEPVVVDEFNQLSLECTPCSQTSDDASPSSVQRVSCNPSPFFFAFYKHHTCKVLIDSGATSTLISYRFAMLAGLEIKPTLNSARQLDKSVVPVRGEVKFTIYYGSLELHVDGLVNDSLTDCDILAGVPCHNTYNPIQGRGENVRECVD